MFVKHGLSQFTIYYQKAFSFRLHGDCLDGRVSVTSLFAQVPMAESAP